MLTVPYSKRNCQRGVATFVFLSARTHRRVKNKCFAKCWHIRGRFSVYLLRAASASVFCIIASSIYIYNPFVKKKCHLFYLFCHLFLPWIWQPVTNKLRFGLSFCLKRHDSPSSISCFSLILHYHVVHTVFIFLPAVSSFTIIAFHLYPRLHAGKPRAQHE